MAQDAVDTTGTAPFSCTHDEHIIIYSTGYHFTPTIHNDTYPAIDPTSASDLCGKTIFITGASKGIGRATAIAYAKAGAAAIGIGARSDLSSLEKEIEETAKNAGKNILKLLSVKLDLTNRESVEQAAKEVDQAFGYVDILINNAARMEQISPIADSDPDEWWETWNVVRFSQPSHKPTDQSFKSAT